MYHILDAESANAFAVMDYVASAMLREGFSEEDVEEYRNHAMCGDYRHLCMVSADLIDQCNERAGFLAKSS